MSNLEIVRSKIVTVAQARALRAEWRAAGQPVVFTNGCFDIMHRGHVEYLSQAADMGRRLVVGLNTDDSVRRLKGPRRPLQDQATRSLVLAALRFVDAVVAFDQDTPYELIAALVPDILVKGGDYAPEQIVGRDIVLAHGGQVRTVALVEGYSTTAVERRM